MNTQGKNKGKEDNFFFVRLLLRFVEDTLSRGLFHVESIYLHSNFKDELVFFQVAIVIPRFEKKWVVLK